jgi:hypothetical protein
MFYITSSWTWRHHRDVKWRHYSVTHVLEWHNGNKLIGETCHTIRWADISLWHQFLPWNKQNGTCWRGVWPSHSGSIPASV